MNTPTPPTSRNPTLADVARDAGVARTTVAEILRGKAGYNADTRKLVSAAARRLGYRPNQLGKALRRGKSMTIGIFTPTIDTPASLAKLEGAEAAARTEGYMTYLLGWGDPRDVTTMRRCLHDMVDRCVDGVLFFDNVTAEPELTETLRQLPMPVVYLDWAPPGEKHVIKLHRRPAFSAMVDHLASLGHKRVGVTTTPWMRQHPEFKTDMMCELLEAAGIEADASPRWFTDHCNDKSGFVKAAYDIATRAVAEGDLPTALIASNDDVAIGAISAFKEAGLNVPGDISVVGHNDDPYASVLPPRLTTIRQPRRDVGVAAFAMLHELMKNPQAEVAAPSFDFELIVRDSTGPASAR